MHHKGVGVGLAFVVIFCIALAVQNILHLFSISEINIDTEQDAFTYSSVLFVGDIMLARNVEYLMNKNGATYPFIHVDSLTRDAYIVGNFEAAIPAVHVPTPSYTFHFSVLKENLNPLTEFGVTHVSLANNHSFDFGATDYKNTTEVLQEYGLQYFGHPYEEGSSTIAVLKTKGGLSVSIIGINLVGHSLSAQQIETIVYAASSQSDLQVLFVHWGEEYTNTHNEEQEHYAQTFIDAGVDVIVGHHPHVVQDIDIYNGVPIFYSLGNFIFDQYFSDDVQKGLVLDMNIHSNSIQFKLIPISSIGSISAPYVMQDAQKEQFLADLARKSNQGLYDMIHSGEIVIER